MPDSIRVLIADDHPIVRYGLRSMITNEPDMELVGEATTGSEVVRKARSLKPSVILVDMHMPEIDGLTTVRQIKQENADARIMILTAFAEDEAVLPVIRAGALGYLSKEASTEQLLQGIRAVHGGKCPLDPAAAARLIRHFDQSQPKEPPVYLESLSKSETEILKLVAQGLSNQEIARELLISERTVGNHVSNILSKLQLSNRTQAALYALRKGIATLVEQATPPHQPATRW